jgi:hypothetical protein
MLLARSQLGTREGRAKPSVSRAPLSIYGQVVPLQTFVLVPS